MFAHLIIMDWRIDKMTDLCEIQFIYNFVSANDSITNKDQRNVAKILSVDATLTIMIGGELYFETELAILEFYKALWQWKQSVTDDKTPIFHYYTVEYADYEDGAILSLIPFGSKARVTSIWAEQPLENVFDVNKIVSAFLQLETDLKHAIEQHFNIDLSKFLNHIPVQYS